MAALTSVTAGLTDGHAADAERLKRGLDIVEFERLDDGGDELHACTFLARSGLAMSGASRSPPTSTHRRPGRAARLAGLPRTHAARRLRWLWRGRSRCGLRHDSPDDVVFA